MTDYRNIDWWKTFLNSIPIIFLIMGYLIGLHEGKAKYETHDPSFNYKDTEFKCTAISN